MKNVFYMHDSAPSQKAIHRKVPAKFHALASGLMFKLRIQQNRSLVSVIGNGNEHSNHDAIITWICTRYSFEEIDSMDTPLESLTKALYQFLDNSLNNQELASC